MIYIHVPFCRSFCVYCDFYSEAGCKESAMASYIDCLKEEIGNRRDEISRTLDTNTLYIGGGTPSVMPLPFFDAILQALPVKSFDEFTVEVNPDDIVTRGKDFCAALKALGVNRISMGVQSFDDSMLRWMRRRHDSAGAEEAYRILRGSGFDNISLDLIFGVGGMSMASLERSLGRLLELRPEHISAYQLSVEEGTPLDRMYQSGEYVPACDEECSAQYYLICEKLRDAGYRHYEISNWALPDRESRHNSAYWARVPYVGLGPGAHSFGIRKDGSQIRSWNSQALSGWKSESETLSPGEIREEQIMLGLRREEGTVVDGKVVRIPEDKWFVSDAIIRELI